jgi:hypothetical protein
MKWKRLYISSWDGKTKMERPLYTYIYHYWNPYIYILYIWNTPYIKYYWSLQRRGLPAGRWPGAWT